MREYLRRLGVIAALALVAASTRAQTAPAVFGTAIGVSSITWTWSGSNPTGGYRVLSSTGGGNISGDLSVSASSFTLFGLSTNTATAVTIEAFGPGTADTPSTVFTQAAQPSGSLLLDTNGNTSSLSWLSNGNPAGTSYNVEWFVAGSTPIILSTQPVVNVVTSSASATIGALPSGQTVDFLVQAVNGDGIATPFDVLLSTSIPTIANQAAISSGTFALGISSIAWSWTASTGAINYQLFEASGVAVSPLLGPSPLNFAQTGLTPNTLYEDYIQAFGLTSSTNTASFARYTLAAPTNNLKLVSLSTGTATETLSWNANGNPPNTTYLVEWWTPLTSTVTVSTQAPTAVISGLSGGASVYFTIQAKNGDGILSDFDSTLTGSPVVYSTYMPVATTNLPFGFSGKVTYVLPNAVVQIELSSGTFSSAVSLTVSTVPANVLALPPWPPLSGGQTPLTSPIAFQVQALDIASGTPQTPLLPLIVSVYYPPAGTGLAPVDPATASIARADAAHNLWIPLATSRNGSDFSLHAVSTALGLFEVLGFAAGPTDLSQMTVGPNPLRPMVNPGQLMTFRNLPAGARVRIFTYVGEKLADVAADGSGVAAWDGRNAAGSWVASGVYLAVIQGGGTHRTMRVAIER